MYANKFAVAVKVAGKVLREQKDTVRIPFGSEYSVLLKNLNTVKAIVDVYIDGVNAVPGGLVIPAGQELDLERWIKNGNFLEGNKFKFIERTGSIEDHRGIGVEDGLIRIEYKFEKVYQRQDGFQFHNINPIWRVDNSVYGINTLSAAELNSIKNSPISGSLGDKFKHTGISGSTMDSYSVNCSTASVQPQSALRNVSLNNISTTKGIAEPMNDTGITVPGSKSEQKFTTASWFPTEIESHSMVFKLIGKTKDNEPVTEAVTVKHKVDCSICNRKNKSNAKFCSNCGAALLIYS